MMSTTSRPAELVLRCDPAGVITTVEHDRLGLCRELAPGAAIIDLIDPASRSKAALFLDHLRREGFHQHPWELNFSTSGLPMLLQSAGGHLGQGRYCIIATTGGSPQLALTLAIYDLLALDGEARGTLERLAGSLSGESVNHSGAPSEAALREIGWLNNKLTEAQRELGRQNAALERAIKELQLALRSNSELEHFAAVVAHDLVAPARQVRQLASLLSGHEAAAAPPDDRSSQWLRHMTASALRIEKLVTDTLSYAKLNGAGEPFAPVPLNEVVDEAAETLSAPLDACGGRVERDAELPVAVGSRTQLRTLFENLIGNAVRYRKPDAPPLIRIAASRPSPAFWSVTVRDNGIGIAPENQERIFEMYTRLDPAHAGGAGSGIGLATCRRVMALHGGTIRVESAPGQGAAFHLLLPFAKPVPGGLS